VRPGLGQLVATVAACSFVGTSIFALSGLLLADPGAGIGELLTVILVAVVWDVVLTPVVLPLVMRLFARLEPARAHV
jgi:rod shape-determining protein MreD